MQGIRTLVLVVPFPAYRNAGPLWGSHHDHKDIHTGIVVIHVMFHKLISSIRATPEQRPQPRLIRQQVTVRLDRIVVRYHDS
jgi:hypothetical protein